jgi:2-polyprenyl-3-methyl-5-hydroxy-6-metoxy-1,4-benzoquinol methylase
MKVEGGIVVGNAWNKYGSSNPIVRRLMQNFHTNLMQMIAAAGGRTVHEVGCGEGHVTRELSDRFESVIASDISQLCIQEARKSVPGKNVQFIQSDLLTLDRSDHQADLIMCCEVLEHLPEPEEALSVLRNLCRSQVILSVPREPLWRVLNVLRAKYLRDFGNTPGHRQHWSRQGFIRFVGTQFEILEVRCPLPWTMLRCRPR